MLALTISAPTVEATSITASVESKITIEIDHHDSTPAPESYTGVIVDCRGLGLQRAMSPVITNLAGDVLYGDKILDPDLVAAIGMVDYATDIHDATRAGNRPLVVRAVKLNNFNSNPVLNVADTEKILRANNAANFFDSANVVFLTDSK